MANETNYSPCKYTGNGETVEFSFTWKIFDASDIMVTVENILTGVQQTKTYGVDYSVSFGEVGGYITFNSAPTSDYYVIITRDVPEYQSKSYSTSTGFQGSEIENSFDRVSCNLQEIDYTLKRAVKVAVGSADLDLTLPRPENGKVLRWDNDNKIINSTTNIDELDDVIEDIINASDYAKNAKQYAIGEPEEPVEGSAKYWATQGFQADWNQSDNTKVDYIKNKPDLTLKLDKDLTNASQTGIDNVISWTMPDYTNGQAVTLANNVWRTVTQNVWVCVSFPDGWWILGIKDKNGNLIPSPHNDGAIQGIIGGGKGLAIVPKDYSYMVNGAYTNVAVIEYPLKGAN